MELHSFVRGDKSQLLIEADRIGPAFVGGELHHLAAALFRALDGPRDQFPADALRPNFYVHAHAFDQRPPTPAICHIRNKRELQHRDDRARSFGDDQVVVGVPLDDFEGGVIAFRERQRVVSRWLPNLSSASIRTISGRSLRVARRNSMSAIMAFALALSLAGLAACASANGGSKGAEGFRRRQTSNQSGANKAECLGSSHK